MAPPPSPATPNQSFFSSLTHVSVLKVGGAVLEDPAKLEAFIGEFLKVEGPKILVHGGGRKATELCEKLGIPTRMVQGRRVTSKETLEVVTMAYAGTTNKGVVVELAKRGESALGMSGADMNLLRSHVRPPVEIDGEVYDFGYVGDIDSVNVEVLDSLLERGIVPVICSLSFDGTSLLNTNADSVASSIAVALAKGGGRDVDLYFCFEKRGILADQDDESSLIPSVTPGSVERLISEGTISGGMIPKVHNALRAVESGVSRVFITSYKSPLGGTVVTK